MSDILDPAKLKVVELRAELSSRGLDTKGNKAVLVDRLREALEKESGQKIEETSILETSTEDAGNVSTTDEPSLSQELNPSEDEMKETDTGVSSDPVCSSPPATVEATEGQESSGPVSPSVSAPVSPPVSVPVHPPDSDIDSASTPVPASDPDPDLDHTPTSDPASVSVAPASSPVPVISPASTSTTAMSAPSDSVASEPVVKKEDIKSEVIQSIKKEHIEQEMQPDIKVDKNVKVKQEQEGANATVKVEKTAENPAEDVRGRDGQRGEKRKHSPPPPAPRHNKSPQRVPDDEPEYSETDVILSWYDSDLHLKIDKKNFTSACPMYKDEYGYIWAGTRSTYGVSKGRVCFEVKLLENCDVGHLEDEPNPHVLRVGWSAVLTSLQLGEEPKSYGYGGTGKASTDCKFKNYGKPFIIGDVVGAFLDLDSNPIIMSFTVNGEPQGVAYEISASELEGDALFPHVLTKNISFQCNFGDQPSWFPPLAGYTPVGKVPIDQRVPGPKRPEKRSDCEIIMMCGLPGCGKTTWANEWKDKHPSKFYNILGTNNLLDKMKVMGLPRKRNYAGRWDVLINRCTKGLNKMLDIAYHRRRNYILDQTNVYPSAQRRKMRGFEGFLRRAVVVVPTDEEFKRRIEKREKLEGKDVPDSAVLEMKANFVLPMVGDIFDEVVYTELPERESRTLISQYNEEARNAGFNAQHKRPRLDTRERPISGGGFRGGGNAGGGGGSGSGGFRQRGGGGGSSAGRMDMKGRGGSWQPRGSGNIGGNSGGGRWDRSQQSAPFRRGGGGGGSGWRGGGSGRDQYGSRNYEGRPRTGGGASGGGSGGGGSGGRSNQGGGKNWGNTWSGGNNSGWSGSSGGGGGSGNSGNWGNQQGYNQSSNWGNQQGYSQQGSWKGYGQQNNYGQNSSSSGGGGGGSGGGGSSNYNQQSYNQPSYGNGYQNWNQQYYNQGYQGNQGWGQAGSDGSYSNYGQQQQPPVQQGSWQSYGQNYNYGTGGSGQHMTQGYGK